MPIADHGNHTFLPTTEKNGGERQGNSGKYKWLNYNQRTPVLSMIYVLVKIHYNKS